MCIAEDKSYPITCNSSHMKTAIEQGKSSFQNFPDVCLFGMRFIFIHQEMIDNFHHSGEIALFLKLSRINIYEAKQFIRVYQIEIASKRQITSRNGMTFYKRVTKFHVVSSLCSISQMAQQHFTHKFHMTFHKTGMFFYIRVKFLKIIHLFPYLSENVRNGLRCSTCLLYTSDAAD